VGIAVLFVLLVNPSAHGSDAYGYWSFDPVSPYSQAMGNTDASVAFRYAPPVALLLMPLHAIPWPLFITGWTIGLAVALWYLGRGWAFALLALYPVALEVSYGNVSLLLAVAIVVGFRYPGAWAIVLLTKVTPGVGLLWFAFRREWARLAVVVAAVLGLAAVSYLIAPALWPQWVAMLQSDIVAPSRGAFAFAPLPMRLVAAAALVAWGARTDRRWVVPIAAGVAFPVPWLFSPVMLGAFPLLVRERPLRSSVGEGVGAAQDR
jgi:hypothetical protein